MTSNTGQRLTLELHSASMTESIERRFSYCCCFNKRRFEPGRITAIVCLSAITFASLWTYGSYQQKHQTGWPNWSFNLLSLSSHDASPKRSLKDDQNSVFLHQFPIDAVITHVTDDDPEFQAQLQSAVAKYGNQTPNFSAAKNRFADYDDLRILLRSIDLYAINMFRRIFVVLAFPSQVPKWLNLEHPKLKIVYHADIWKNRSDLPVFNSLAIEANLHHINGLSEYFVYFNNDVALLANLSMADFFSTVRQKQTHRLRLNLRLSRTAQTDNTRRDEIPAHKIHYFGSAVQTTEAISNICNKTRQRIVGFGKVPSHMPHVLVRSVLFAAERDPRLAALVQRTQSSKFRFGYELNSVMLFNHYSQCALDYLAEEDKHTDLLYVSVDYATTNRTFIDRVMQLTQEWTTAISKGSVKFLCLNDRDRTHESEEGKALHKFILDWRSRFFPITSSFELPLHQ